MSQYHNSRDNESDTPQAPHPLTSAGIRQGIRGESSATKILAAEFGPGINSDYGHQTRVTFDELVEHGKAQGANIVNGMPWSFDFNGYPVTHETDECYLITTPQGTLRLEKGGTLTLPVAAAPEHKFIGKVRVSGMSAEEQEQRSYRGDGYVEPIPPSESPSDTIARLRTYRAMMDQIEDGLNGRPFHWNEHQARANMPLTRGDSGIGGLMTKEDLEMAGFRLKRGVEPVGYIDRPAPASDKAPVYVLRCQCVHLTDDRAE